MPEPTRGQPADADIVTIDRLAPEQNDLLILHGKAAQKSFQQLTALRLQRFPAKEREAFLNLTNPPSPASSGV